VRRALGALVLFGCAAPHTRVVAPRGEEQVARALVGRLDLERYKANIRALTRFGDRRQGTERNRRAVDFIDAELRASGCVPERHRFHYDPAKRERRPPRAPGVAAGGGRARGVVTETGVNTDPMRQPDPELRALDREPETTPGERENVYCTKIGAARPDEMYLVGAHLDGIGYGEAANDDASGAAIVMQLARVFAMPDVVTARSIRFVLWNNEETGLDGSRAYVAERASRQGREEPPGSGRYPEPRWLGMIQHDMMLFDHGMPRPDGTVSATPRPEADVNIEFQSAAKKAGEGATLAWFFQRANEKYASDYPASVGSHMTNTDSTPFQDHVAAISLRENERGTQIGSGWDPHWHQPTDLYATFSDADFRLGLNAAQTTLGALAELAGASLSSL